jgi:formylmethanofuran dehydrogenase subunit E
MSEVVKERIARLRAELHKNPALICSKCGSVIHETITGKYETADGVLCKLCFSEILGAEIEKHPIRSAPTERASK